ncbi:bifunctional allantoicase/OHCU decarboxylase, partial [Acidobacteriia bacterium AH_259_A11_L15]|nr:bifunctional allantoicase/OHCU decarboxylase [Acidobacteriia bacterium AH_259_A11_L15]
AEGASLDALTSSRVNWKEVLPRTQLAADTQHVFENELHSTGPITHVRFNIFPDGGVSRLRVFGQIRREGR